VPRGSHGDSIREEARNSAGAAADLAAMRIAEARLPPSVPVPSPSSSPPSSVAEREAGPVPAAPDRAAEPSAFARLLRGLGKEVDRGERVVRRAIDHGGAELGSGELLALQAGVYRYSEAVDLSAKLVDRATSGLKTVLQNQ